jgi:ankyrin repeat protein
MATALSAGAAMGGGRALIRAVMTGDEARVRAVLKKYPQAIDASDAWGRTALHWAAGEGHLHLVELLINAEAEVNAKNKDGDTPLHEAVFRGYDELARFLLSQGAYVNAANKAGVTPLHYAAGLGRRSLVELLLDKGAAINARSVGGLTPLSAAVRGRHLAVAALLRERGGIDPLGRTGPRTGPDTHPDPRLAATRAKIADVVRAFFRAGAKGDLKAARRLSFGRMRQDLPPPDDDLFLIWRLVCAAFDSVGRVAVVGHRATVRVYFDETTLAARLIRLRWGVIVHPRKRLLAWRFIQQQVQGGLDKVRLVVVEQGGRWLVSDLIQEK